MGQTIHQNRSSSLHFQDKHAFVFYAEIQDGHQKQFWQKLASRICRSPGIKSFVEIALALSVFKINTFYTKIQDGHQKWQEIALALSVSKINTFYTEIQDGHQKWQENNFGEKWNKQIPLGSKFSPKSL